jgi:hypothetical protein
VKNSLFFFLIINVIEPENSLIAAASGATGKGANSTAVDKSGGSLGKRWLVAEMLCGILPFVFVSYMV